MTLLAVDVSGQTLAIIAGSLGGIAALAGARSNHARVLFDEHRWLYEEAKERIAVLEAKVRELSTEVEKWRRRAQDWRKANGEEPWPE